MSNILITGGMGVVGSWVTRQLIERGEKIVSYDRFPDTLLLKDIVNEFENVAEDILDLPGLISTIQKHKIERIIHLAAIMPGPMEANPYSTYRINVDGTINVLEAVRLTGVGRVICASSVAVYGDAHGEYCHPTYKLTEEDDPKVPWDMYGSTKLFGEYMCLNYNRIYGVDVILLRFGSTYGPGKQVRHGALALQCKVIESAMLKQPLKIPQGGDQKWDMIYNRDVANGVVLACFAEELQHRIFHIGMGYGESIKHMMEILDTLLGGVPLEIGPGLNPRIADKYINSYRVLSIERAKKELGYSPRYDMASAVKDYIEEMNRLDITPVVL